MIYKAAFSKYAHDYLKRRSTDLLTDECVVERIRTSVLDPETNEYSYGERVELWRGPCRLWQSNAGVAVTVNDEQTEVATVHLSFPWDMDPIPEMEDLVTITKSPDPDIVGRSFTLGTPTRGGNLRSTRLFAVKGEASSKDEW